MPLLLILVMTNDEEARVECLNSTYELGNEFERLSRVQRNTARTEKDDYDCLINIKNICLLGFVTVFFLIVIKTQHHIFPSFLYKYTILKSGP